MSEDTPKQEVPVADSEESSTGVDTEQPNVDHLLHENRKYRTRAQESEAKLAELEKKFTSIEEAQLKEKEDFKALYEKVSSENESLSSTAKKWESYEKNRRETLLESVPEEKRERLLNLDLDTLEFVTSEMNSTKSNAPEVVGNSRGKSNVPKDWTTLSPDELRENWDDIVKGAQSRMKKN